MKNHHEYPVGAHLIAGFDGTEPSPEILELIRNHHLGGVILYGKNCTDAEGVSELTRQLRLEAKKAGREKRLLIAVDQEMGSVARITGGMTLFPAMADIARIGDPSLVERVAAVTGGELLTVGVNWNLAPVADVISDPVCPIGNRSFGPDPSMAAELTAAYVRGAAESGILNCAKHFPGHGGVGMDSHIGAPEDRRSRSELEQCDLVPFRSAIAAGVSAVMTTHVTFPAIDPEHPASLSPRIIGGLLRRDLGFGGVTVSDDLEMAGVSVEHSLEKSALLALAAGTDLLIVSRMILPDRDIFALLDSLQKAVKSGSLPRDALDASRKRIALMSDGTQQKPAPLRDDAHLKLLTEINERIKSDGGEG